MIRLEPFPTSIAQPVVVHFDIGSDAGLDGAEQMDFAEAVVSPKAADVAAAAGTDEASAAGEPAAQKSSGKYAEFLDDHDDGVVLMSASSLGGGSDEAYHGFDPLKAVGNLAGDAFHGVGGTIGKVGGVVGGAALSIISNLKESNRSAQDRSAQDRGRAGDGRDVRRVPLRDHLHEQPRGLGREGGTADRAAALCSSAPADGETPECESRATLTLVFAQGEASPSLELIMTTDDAQKAADELRPPGRPGAG